MFTLNNWTRWQLGWLLLCECTGVRKNFNLTVPDVHGSLRRKTRRRRGFLHCAPFWRTVSFSWRGPRRRTRKNNEPSLFTRRFFFLQRRRISTRYCDTCFVGVSPWLHHYYAQNQNHRCLSNLPDNNRFSFRNTRMGSRFPPHPYPRTGSARFHTWHPFRFSLMSHMRRAFHSSSLIRRTLDQWRWRTIIIVSSFKYFPMRLC